MRRVIFVFAFFSALLPAIPAWAQIGDERAVPPNHGVVTAVDQRTENDTEISVYTVRMTDGTEQGKTITIGDNETVTTAGNVQYRIGDHVLVAAIAHVDGTTHYLIVDAERRGALLALVLVFAAAVGFLGRGQGLRSLLGLAFSVAVILWWVVPMVAFGASPVPVAVAAGFVILLVGTLLSEGFSRAFAASTIGILITMVGIGLISEWGVRFAHLTGLAGEEAFYLQGQGAGNFDLRGLLLAGIIIGTLGILDDLALAQVATVSELRRANPKLSNRAVYASAMRVGQTHLAAIVNTLAMAYAGSALPLLVLFQFGQSSPSLILNGEVVATEVVRTVLGSLGIVLALPVVTVSAVLLAVGGPGDRHVPEHSHH